MPTTSADAPQSSHSKRRAVYLLATLIVIAVGLASRKYAIFPSFLGKYPGDALWGLMIWTGLGVIGPNWSALHSPARPSKGIWLHAGVALAICYAVEFSQLLKWPWLDDLRATTLGHLILGSDFHWGDLLAYVVGIGVGVSLNWSILKGGTLDRAKIGWR